jgi:predicted O-linked N-acetylglucosamine transferase (SPINDLY family)
MTDEAVAALIRRDELDILVELAGHTRNNRLPMLAGRLAPIQITALGYPGTTGLGSIDYKLSDPVADPPGAEAYYTESLLRLPECFWCFSPPEDSPDVSAAPCLANRHVTFGCFGEPCKISDLVLRNWRQILHELPTARMLVKLPRWGHEDNVAYFSDRLRGSGLPMERVQLQGPSVPINAFLQSYEQVDVILDTYPFNGGTTTCLALWMGVPVLTLAGDYLASRMGATILTHCGMSEHVAASSSEYVDKAVALGSDSARLAGMRATIRQRMTSPLTDGKRYVGHLEAAYRKIWMDWCSKQC